jgi:hypothetical protein
MAKAKSLGSDEVVDQTKAKNDSTINLRRTINAGVEVQLSVGTYTVREMPGADFLVFLLDSVELFQGLLGGGDDGLKVIVTALKNDEVMSKIAQFFSLSMGIDSSEINFKKLPLSDYLVLVSACKQAYDWETIQAGFLELGLGEAMKSFLSSTSNNPESE